MALPDIDAGEYLTHEFWYLGPTRAAGMAEAPTDLPVVLAHASTGRITGQEDIDALFLMFRNYFEARSAGEKQGALAPVHQTGDADVDRRQAIALGMKARMQAARDGMSGSKQ